MTTLEGTHNYGYDDIYQLVSATHPSQPAETFTYDPVGNRLSSADLTDWTYDNCNRLLGYDTTTFTYDDNGNTTGKTDPAGTTLYVYDYENRLMAVRTPEHEADYVYDPFGRRLRKTVEGNSTSFVYDNEDIIRSIGSNDAHYFHGSGVDEPVALVAAGRTCFYTFDGLGSVSELTDSAGALVESYSYDVFGGISVPSETENQYTYTAREQDRETKLYFYRARYYNSRTGRFTTRDPIGFGGGPNFYVYVGNNPANYVDPTGMKCEGRWERQTWTRINFVCWCFWLCIPPEGCIWSGNPYGLPKTRGYVIHTGKDIESGDDCLCSPPSD